MRRRFILISFFSLLIFLPTLPFASIIKVPPKIEQKEIPYSELTCTNEHKEIIYEIVTTVAYNHVLKLKSKESHLEKLGEYVGDVHPLKFFSTILTNSELKLCMGDILSSYFKRKHFLYRGLIPSLQRESDKGKLMQYHEDFAKEVGAPAEEIKSFFTSQEWEEMIRYLVSI